MPIAALSLVDLWKVSSSRGRLSTGSHPRCKNRFSRVGVYGVNGDLRRGGLRGVFRADLALLGCCFLLSEASLPQKKKIRIQKAGCRPCFIFGIAGMTSMPWASSFRRRDEC